MGRLAGRTPRRQPDPAQARAVRAVRLPILPGPCRRVPADCVRRAAGDITARNVGTRTAPYGTGCHPYLTAGTPDIDDCELELPAAQWLPPGPRGIPAAGPRDVTGTEYDFRAARPVGGVRLDHAFTGLARDADGRAWARLGAAGRQVSFWAGQGYQWLQVFTGDPLDPPHRRRALAIEPMTCPPNAFVTGHDLISLEPGSTVQHAWGIGVHQA